MGLTSLLQKGQGARTEPWRKCRPQYRRRREGHGGLQTYGGRDGCGPADGPPEVLLRGLWGGNHPSLCESHDRPDQQVFSSVSPTKTRDLGWLLSLCLPQFPHQILCLKVVMRTEQANTYTILNIVPGARAGFMCSQPLQSHRAPHSEGEGSDIWFDALLLPTWNS